MSVDLHLNITGDDEARKRIADKVAQCDPHRVATFVLPRVARHWRNHLAHLPQNKGGFPSTGFWQDAALRVEPNSRVIGGSVLLQSDKLGLRQRLHGGTIAARNHKYITIPICAEAYGTKVADWGMENLTLVILADGRRFFALWLGNDDVNRKFRHVIGATLKKIEARKARMEKEGRSTGVPTHEALSRSVNKFRTTTAFKKPDVIILKGSGGQSTARAERHGNLKFLFVLKESVEQQGNPNVIPPDLGEVALAATLEATK